MAADRQVPTTGAGSTAWADHNVELGKLYDISSMNLVINGGLSTADAIVADPEVPLTGSLVDGMKFNLRPTANNTISGVTIKIPTGGTVFPIVDRDGNALAIAQLKNGRDHILRYDLSSAKMRVQTNIDPTPTAAIPQPAFRNIMLGNGGFEVWQRGAGDSASIAVAANTAYTADRWYLTTAASNEACTVAVVAGITNRSKKAGRVQRNSGQTGVTALIFAYPLTTDEVAQLRGQTACLQVTFKAGANWSPASGTLTYNLYFGTNPEGKRGAGFTGETNPITGTINLTAGGAAQAISVTGSTVATNVTQGELRFTWTPVSTAGAADYVDIDDVQLEANSAPSPIEYPPFALMLSLCQRHFYKSFPYATAPAASAGIAGALIGPVQTDGSGSSPLVPWRFPVQMRTTPTLTAFNPAAAGSTFRIYNYSSFASAASSVTNASASAMGTSSPDGTLFVATTPGSETGAPGANLNAAIHATADAGL